MFPKGPRFISTKVPDIPGPNSYNLNQESQLDSYKRGAFLEKTDRFSEEKLSEIPGPGTYNTNATAATKPSSSKLNLNSNDRYVALQRKLEALEQIHADGKKAHAAELERLKLELSRTQKINTEQTERIDKLRKQNDGLETRLQELKKLNLGDQTEIKELRTKLRVSELERGQLASKQGEAGEVKRSLVALEGKRKEELKERDKKITELEKSLGGEKRKREVVEAKLQGMKGKVEDEVEEARGTLKGLQAQVKHALDEVETAKAQTSEVEKREERLIEELENARSVMQRVAEEYGRLAASTVSLSSHEQLKHEHVSLTFRAFRLERKLVNSEAQVVELAHLIRGTQDDNIFLSGLLRETQEEIAWYSGSLSLITTNDPGSWIGHRSSPLDECVTAIGIEISSQRRGALEAEVQSSKLFWQWNTLQNGDILRHYKALVDDLNVVQEQNRSHQVALSTLNSQRDQSAARLERVQKEHDITSRQASEYSAYLEESKAKEEELKREMEAREKQRKTETIIIEEKLNKERESVAQLTSTIRQRKMSEEALCAEIELLTSELTEAERYQDAYNALVEEVGALIDRNALAEEEAEKLSEFNAEILGHSNPAQRIMYVDRIRKELAETKQKLLMTLRDRDAVYTNNEELKGELDLYKSVTVPIEDKPRTILTRVGRVPLADQNLNVN